MADLPEYLTDQTEATILQRILARFVGYDTSQGSPHYNIADAHAIEFALAATWAQEILRRGFAQTTFGDYLTYRADEHGITRKAAVAATGTVTFTGTAGTPVPAGSTVSTSSTATQAAIIFTTNADATIATGQTTVDVAVTAQTAGAAGNVAAGAITFVSPAIDGITAVTNASATSGGLDEETDDALLARYLSAVRSPGTSGNKSDYSQWALSITGTGAAQVIPLWNGAGTVKVVLLGTDMTPATSTVVDAVQAYIDPGGTGNGDGAAPIGAAVTVVAATGVSIAVSATLTLDGTRTLSEVTTDFTAALVAYLAGIAFATDPSVKYVKIGSTLLDVQGVTDYASLTVNGGTANITINQGEVAVAGAVTFS